ncbi:hypothetical protein [Rhodococcus erythropolis]|nr:hypothetical protein [Rhodococcus erythropolis]
MTTTSIPATVTVADAARVLAHVDTADAALQHGLAYVAAAIAAGATV